MPDAGAHAVGLYATAGGIMAALAVGGMAKALGACATHAEADGEAGKRQTRTLWGRSKAVWAGQVLLRDFIALRSLRSFSETFGAAATNPAETGSAVNARMRTKSGHPVYLMVLTGGPCGGKSTSLSHLNERLTALGFRVYSLPEAATIVINTGALPTFGGPGGWSKETMDRFQEGIVSMTLACEESVLGIALSRDEPAVIVCDRGMADIRAYVDDDVYEAALGAFKLTPEMVYERYDAVVHLVSAAVGASHAYTTANNAARTETADQAATLDTKTQAAWQGHHRHFIIDNSTDFTGKVRRVTQAIASVVGLPVSASDVRRRFRIDTKDALQNIPAKHVTSKVTRTYLKSSQWASDGIVASVTMRESEGTGDMYVHRLSRPSDHSQVERMLAKRDYESALDHHADPDTAVIEKMCRTFTVVGTEGGKEATLFCSLETYESPKKLRGASFLNVNASSLDGELVLPAPLGGVLGVEVTHDRAALEAVLAGVVLTG